MTVDLPLGGLAERNAKTLEKAPPATGLVSSFDMAENGLYGIVCFAIEME